MSDDAELEVRSRALDPDGRLVVLRDAQWLHILSAHPEMARFERAMMETVTHPMHRLGDIRPNRERFFSAARGPTSWLRVVIDYSRQPAFVVTAFGQDDAP